MLYYNIHQASLGSASLNFIAISGMISGMKQYAELNKVGMCHALRETDLYVKPFAGGYPYLDGDEVKRSSEKEPIYSYGKNYELDGEEYALFVWTLEEDKEKVSKALDEASKKATKENLRSISGVGEFKYVADLFNVY